MKFLNASQHQQIKGGSAAPSVSAHSNAGTGASAALASGSTDSAGQVQLTTGTTPAGNGTIVTVTFAKAYSAAPFVALQKANANAAGLFNNITSVEYVAASTTNFEIKVDGPIEPSLNHYAWNYHVIG